MKVEFRAIWHGGRIGGGENKQSMELEISRAWNWILNI